MNRLDTLKAAAECVCGSREEDYGSPEDNFAVIAALWTAYTGTDVTPKDVAMMMALLKIARAKAGSKPDTYIDLAGYAACGAEISAREPKRKVHASTTGETGGTEPEKNGVLREAAAHGRLLSGGSGRESASLYAVGNRDAVHPRSNSGRKEEENMKKMRCFLKRPKSDWYSTCCSISLSNLQRIVGGYIETVTFPDLGGVVICNEEGRLLGLPYCCTIRGVDFVGCVAVFCPDGDTLRDVQYELRKWKEIVAD